MDYSFPHSSPAELPRKLDFPVIYQSVAGQGNKYPKFLKGKFLEVDKNKRRRWQVRRPPPLTGVRVGL
jgi:hypothetical protein